MKENHFQRKSSIFLCNWGTLGQHSQHDSLEAHSGHLVQKWLVVNLSVMRPSESL